MGFRFSPSAVCHHINWFWWVSNIPLCENITIYLLILQLVGVWVISRSPALWTALWQACVPWPLLCKNLPWTCSWKWECWPENMWMVSLRKLWQVPRPRSGTNCHNYGSRGRRNSLKHFLGDFLIFSNKIGLKVISFKSWSVFSYQ